MTILIIFTVLGVLAIAGTVDLLRRDGYRPVPTDRMRIPDRDRAPAPLPSTVADPPATTPPEARDVPAGRTRRLRHAASLRGAAPRPADR